MTLISIWYNRDQNLVEGDMPARVYMHLMSFKT